MTREEFVKSQVEQGPRERQDIYEACYQYVAAQNPETDQVESLTNELVDDIVSQVHPN